jgi:hypothetical protein
MKKQANLTVSEGAKIIDSHFEKLEASIISAMKEAGIIQDLMLKTADDVNLNFGDEIQEASQIQVGTSGVKLDSGALADGEYTMPSGVKLVISQGVVKEIIQPSADAIAASIRQTMTDLRNQVRTLKAARGRKAFRETSHRVANSNK